MRDKSFRFVDIFAGIGGFRMGFENAGAECVYSIEFDKYKRKQYEIIFGHEPDADDIRTVEARDIPEAECWCAGFPCTNNSIAGDMSGLAGDKSGLFFQLIRLLKELPEEDRPNYLLLENVRNLLSVNKGFDFARILVELDGCGYDVQWQVIDSKYYVPQHRERIYIVGCLRAKRKSAEQILPIEIPIVEDEVEVKQVMERVSHRNNPNQYRVYDPDGIAPTLTTAGGGGRTCHVRIYATDRQTDRQTDRHIIVIGTTHPHRHSNGDIHDPKGIMPTLCQRDYKQPRLIAVKMGGETDGR